MNYFDLKLKQLRVDMKFMKQLRMTTFTISRVWGLVLTLSNQALNKNCDKTTGKQTKTRTVRIPRLIRRCPAATPVVWPAIFVFFRAFLNPSKRQDV